MSPFSNKGLLHVLLTRKRKNQRLVRLAPEDHCLKTMKNTDCCVHTSTTLLPHFASPLTSPHLTSLLTSPLSSPTSLLTSPLSLLHHAALLTTTTQQTAPINILLSHVLNQSATTRQKKRIVHKAHNPSRI